MTVLNVVFVIVTIMFMLSVMVVLAAIAWYLIDDTELGDAIKERIRGKKDDQVD